jgi:hypothetical protein
MGFDVEKLLSILKATIKKLGLLPVARLLYNLIKVLTQPDFRIQELDRQRRGRVQKERFLQFKRQYGDLFLHHFDKEVKERKRVLIIGAIRLLEIELGLIKAFELAGFEPVVLVMRDSRLLKQYYELLGVKKFYFWSEFCDASRFLSDAKAVVEKLRSIEELLTFEYAGAHVGKNAASMALRHLRLASLDLTVDNVCRAVAEQIALGMASAIAAQNILRRVQPNLALTIETVYSEKGELFDVCLVNNVPVIRWHPAHKSNTLMLKRYTIENRNDNPHSLSAQSWRSICKMDWMDTRREQLQRELFNSYARGDWYGENATQFNKRFMTTRIIQENLGLDPKKKNAFLFPHIFWDASFSYGDNLFDNYEKWFLRTVQAACANEDVNWIIKIHPANLGKTGDSGKLGEPVEVTTLRKHIGELPQHVSLIPAESNISTYSLFDLMDYCVTVRGTIGIEAAMRGIPVLTAGTGRYDHKGFSIDSETGEEYLERIAHIQEIPELSPLQRELAERYAYGLFILRPLPLTTMTLEFDKDNNPDNYFTRTRFNIRNKEEWFFTTDLKAFAEWATASYQEDYLDASSEKLY